MTPRLSPEFKAIRAIERALSTLDGRTRRATIDWLYAREHGTTQGEVARGVRIARRLQGSSR